eukprot:5391575-Pyramimonas_sp.AAC.1
MPRRFHLTRLSRQNAHYMTACGEPLLSVATFPRADRSHANASRGIGPSAGSRLKVPTNVILSHERWEGQLTFKICLNQLVDTSEDSLEHLVVLWVRSARLHPHRALSLLALRTR